MFRAMIVGLGLILTASAAGAAECSVSALQAYRIAQRNGFTFGCDAPRGQSANFTTDRLRGAIGCQGRVTENFLEQSKVYKFEAKFFGTYNRELPELKNGWELAGYTIEGGYYDTTLPADTGLVRYYYYLDQADRSGSRWLTKILLEKEGGDCTQAVKEAFASR